MKKGDILENVIVEKLVFWWKGFVKSEDWKVIFITGWAIPWAKVDLRIIKKKRDFLEAQIINTRWKSPIETGNFIVFPWAPWINIDYKEQLKIKENQIKEAFFHLEKFQENLFQESENIFLPIMQTENTLWYRNKIEFSFGKYISHKEEIEEHFNVGFHKQGQFSKVIDYDSCDLIDDEANTIYKEIKDFSKASWLPVYDQKTQVGFWRHIIIRKTYFTDEVMIILSLNEDFLENEKEKKEWRKKIQSFFEKLTKKFPKIQSIYLSINDNKADIAIGKLELIFWKTIITEKILWLLFDIGPKSFFQTNSLGAEKLYSVVRNFAKKETLSDDFVLDLYAGTWTIGMIFAPLCKQVYSVELVEEASKNGAKNAEKNKIENIDFINAKVEDFLASWKDDFTKKEISQKQGAGLLIIDPPRAGMHPSTLPSLLDFESEQILYVSCNPATLGRDLAYILQNAPYKIQKVQAVDMFPHTHHIETVVSLIRKNKT